MPLDRIPRPVRAAVFVLAIAVVVWLSLAPAEEVAGVTLWDKAQHAIAYAGLAVLGLALFPGARASVAVGLVALGAGVEVAQSAMGLGREGDARDALANIVGVAVVWSAFYAARRRGGRRP